MREFGHLRVLFAFHDAGIGGRVGSDADRVVLHVPQLVPYLLELRLEVHSRAYCLSKGGSICLFSVNIFISFICYI